MVGQKSMRTRFALAIAGCQIALGVLFVAQESSASYFSWDKRRMPIAYRVNADDAASWPEGVGAIIRSFLSWQRTPGAYLRFDYAGTTDKKGAYDDGQNVVAWVREGWSYGSDTIALAVLWVSRDTQRIEGFDILLNGENFVWATDGDPQAVDVQDVTTHEGGHAIGLNHSVTSTSVTMFPVMAPGETKKRFITEEERSIIRLTYPSGITKVVTYALSGESGDLAAEKVVTDYLSSLGSGTIFLLTGVDSDGDGSDEIGIIQEEEERLSFYLFPAVTSDVPASEPLAYDEWSIPTGEIVDLTALDIDGDGRQEIGVLRAESDGTYALYIYNAPLLSDFTEDDAPSLVLRHAFGADAGDNLVAAVGLDYDGDGIDEVGAVRLTPVGQYFLDVHYVGATDNQWEDEAISIPLGSDFAFTDLDVCDVDDDEDSELVALSKDSVGWCVSAFRLPGPSAPSEEPLVTLLGTAPIALAAGDRPMRITSVRIADEGSVARPAVCVLMGETP